MKLITRDTITKEIIVYLKEEEITYTYYTLVELIDRAKTYLIKERNAKSSQQVFLCPGIFYIPWFYACAELGLTLIVAASPKTKNHLLFNDLYGKIDHTIVPFNNTLYGPVYKEAYKDTIFDSNILKTYDNNEYKDAFYATEDSILIRAISERINPQTITEVNVSNQTHRFYYDLAVRNIQVLGLTKDDRCLHARILHHGSSLGVFFLPSMMICYRHFWCNENTYHWVKHMAEHDITKTMFYNTMIDQFIDRSKRKDWTFCGATVYLLQFPSKEHIRELVEMKKMTLSTVFGMTGTSGPLFLQTITDDNYKEYNFRNFGKVLDDFYQLSINNGKLSIKLPDNTVVNTNDNFSIIDNNYYFTPSI